MRRPLLTLIAAFVLVLGIGMVWLTNVSKEEPLGDSELLVVLVSERDISAGEPLGPLVDDGVFVEIRVPHEAAIKGPVTDLRQLRGRTSTRPIVANEQIPRSFLR